jgi:DNA-directed RNA polymerase subunit M/transcription elongation factor TFIIS
MSSIDDAKQTLIDHLRARVELDPLWATVSEHTRTSILRKLERGCRNLAVVECTRAGIPCTMNSSVFVQRYSAYAYTLLEHLDPTSDVYRNGGATLLDKILGGFSADSAAGAIAAELLPESHAAIRNEIAIRQQQRVERKTSRLYTCRKCGHNETLVTTAQLRAADEAPATLIQCQNTACGHGWKIG